MRRGAFVTGLAVMEALGCRSLHPAAGQSHALVSQAGRDHALVQLIQGARRSLFLRTERITLVPIGNELAQAVQRGVAVNLELPLEAGLDPQDSRLPRMLMDLGAVVAFKEDPTGSIKGAYLEVDGTVFLYSAAPATICLEGARVSYVSGPIWR